MFHVSALRNAFLGSLVAAVLVLVLLLLVIFPTVQNLVVQNTEEDVGRLSRHFIADILTDLKAMPSRPQEAKGRISAYLGQVHDQLKLYKLRLFNPEGVIIHSSVPEEVGRSTLNPAIHELMRQGGFFSKLERKGGLTTDGAPVTLDVVETYLPIRDGEVLLGIFEVYTDVTTRASVQGHLLMQAGGMMAAAVLGLLLLLFRVMRTADRNIREQQRLEARVREAAMVFEASSDGICMTDPQGVIRRVNPTFTEITGYTAEEAVGHTPALLRSGRHPPEFYADFWRCLKERGEWEGEIFNRQKGGRIYPQWLTVRALRDNQGGLSGYVAQLSEVARRRLTEEEIRYRANYDALTGLANRSLLIERVEYAMIEAQRLGKRVGVLFIDLDHFKQINDTLGHLFGDQLLQEAGRMIRSCVRSTDTVGRQGGDEFVVVLPGIEVALEAGVVAQKVLGSFAQPVALAGQEIHVTPSIGVAIYPDDGEQAMELYARADLAMYRSKESGRNAIHFFEPAMTEAALHRRQLENDLRHALERGELSLHYQPIVGVAEGRMIGVESLARWHHPERGWVGPDTFIPVAEELGLINQIGQWVLEQTCAQLQAWHRDGLLLYGAVNLSGRQIPGGITPDGVLDTVSRFGLTPAWVMLEITEGVLIKDLEATCRWVDGVRAVGFRIALDDFGTGYSSLAYLRRLHIDLIKIDKSFVRELAAQKHDRQIVDSVIAMSHRLGAKVTAEGVESEEQLGLLTAMGCDNFQGYLLSRPVPPERIPVLVETLSLRSPGA